MEMPSKLAKPTRPKRCSGRTARQGARGRPDGAFRGRARPLLVARAASAYAVPHPLRHKRARPAFDVSEHFGRGGTTGGGNISNCAVRSIASVVCFAESLGY